MKLNDGYLDPYHFSSKPKVIFIVSGNAKFNVSLWMDL